MSDRVPMTLAGSEKLKAELDQLKRVDRQDVIRAISEARAHGDLKENAEYHAAKERQGFIEARIRDLEGKLSNAHIIDVTQIPNEGKVIFGSTVTILNVDTEETYCYHIVGEDEADLKSNKLSVSAPIARALIGKCVDIEVVVNTPQGEVTYEIVEVEYK